MEKKIINNRFNKKSLIPTKESKIILINQSKKELQSSNKNIINNWIDKNIENNIIINKKNNEDNNINNKYQENNIKKDNDIFDDIFLKYNSLFNDNILKRFSIFQKINIINKLNLILFNKIKKELELQLKRKQLENQLLKIRNGYKDKLIKKKKLYSLIQQKMLRDYNFKKKLKDLRKKLMDEKINLLREKNLEYIMKSYGIYNEDKSYR